MLGDQRAGDHLKALIRPYSERVNPEGMAIELKVSGNERAPTRRGGGHFPDHATRKRATLTSAWTDILTNIKPAGQSNGDLVQYRS